MVGPSELCFQEGRGWIEFRQIEAENYIRFASRARAGLAGGVWDEAVEDAIGMIDLMADHASTARLRFRCLAFLAKVPPALLHAARNPPADCEDGDIADQGESEPDGAWSPDAGSAA